MELSLFLDHDCNLRCRYCYGGRKFRRPMSLDTMKRAVALALAKRPARLDVSFFGGEPLLHPALVEATIAEVERARELLPEPRPRVEYVMNTNGTLLDERVLALLSPPRPFTIYLSLDGPEEIHDAARVDPEGRGCFAVVVSNLRVLRKAGIRVSLVAVVRPETARHLGKVAQTLFDEGKDHVVVAPDFRASWTEAAILDLRAGLREATEVWKHGFRRGRVVCFEPLHTKILTHLNQGIPCPERCTLAGKTFAVAPSGRLYPCAQMIGEDPEPRDGDGCVIGTMDAGFDHARMQALQATKERVEETCAPCALRARCQSHCGCRHLALTGELGRINQALCEIEESFILAADEMASAMLAESCPAFVETYYRRTYRPAEGASLVRLRRPGEGDGSEPRQRGA